MSIYDTNDALLVVDMQSDFCPGGNLAVEEGDRVVPVLNKWIDGAQRENIPVFMSRDWHPKGHCSFKEEGGPWPAHCVQETPGAAFHPDLHQPTSAKVITKGQNPDFDQYSAFDRTGLADEMRERGIERVWCGGLAEDVCVRASAIDGAREGFDVKVILPATRPVDKEKVGEAREEMREAGVELVEQESPDAK